MKLIAQYLRRHLGIFLLSALFLTLEAVADLLQPTFMQDLRAAFGVVLQDTALFTQSVKENIRYGHPEATMEQIEAAARTAEADGFISKLPEGYYTVLRQGGMELSQGERQLLSIARAVLTNAPILILDEATSSVDTVTEQKIRRAMLKICQNRTSFIIAHRLSTIRDSDWILLIENGEIAEQGTHASMRISYCSTSFQSMFSILVSTSIPQFHRTADSDKSHHSTCDHALNPLLYLPHWARR